MPVNAAPALPAKGSRNAVPPVNAPISHLFLCLFNGQADANATGAGGAFVSDLRQCGAQFPEYNYK